MLDTGSKDRGCCASQEKESALKDRLFPTLVVVLEVFSTNKASLKVTNFVEKWWDTTSKKKERSNGIIRLRSDGLNPQQPKELSPAAGGEKCQASTILYEKWIIETLS